MMKLKTFLLFGLLVFAALSCGPKESGVGLEKLPYFDLKSFVNLQAQRLNEKSVLKSSRINGEEETAEQVYSEQDWKEEFDAFIQADINTPSLALSYSTEVFHDNLVHRLLPDEKGKVKEIKVRYVRDLPVEVSFKLQESNLFFSATTFGSIFINQQTQLVDHYSIETTQKVMFLKPTNIKIQGVVRQ